MGDPRRASIGHTAAQRPIMGPPETPSRVMHPSPNMFPTLQFSPELFSNSPYGPATAPVYPQQRLFWDPNFAGADATTGLQQYQDPFAMAQNDFSGSFTSVSTVVPSFDPSPQLATEQPYDLPQVSRPMTTSYVDRAAFPAPFHTSPRVLPPRDDNPSMFLSSPARRFGNPEPHLPRAPGTTALEKPAYHHQIEESRREKEAKRTRKSGARHPSVTRSVMEALRRPVSPVKESRPGLKRSLTHSGVGGRHSHLRQQSHVSFLDNISTTSGSTNQSRNGRSSPLKQATGGIQKPHVSKWTSKRASVSLSIDEDGRARTIVSNIQDDEMNLDDDSSDSEASSRDHTDFEALRSQQNSFAFDDEEETDHLLGSRDKLHRHSKSSSHSTMNSNASAWQSSRTSSSTSAFTTRNAPIARATGLRPSLRTENEVNMLDTYGGDAQQALRAIIQDRSRSTSANDSVGSHHSARFNSSPPIQQNHFSTFNASPTTITDPDLATPSTDRESFSSNSSTRCVCHSTDTDPNAVMIQWYVLKLLSSRVSH